MSTSQLFTIASSIAVVVLLLVALKRFATHRDFNLGLLGLAVLVTVSARLATSGALADFSRTPPPMVGLIVGLFALAVGATLSPWGARVSAALPLRWLVGLQGFRVLPETLLALANADGVAPIQMTFHGRNFDIVTALTAIVLAVAWPKLKSPRAAALAFGALGMALLANILGIAVLSMPTPLRLFMNEPANTFVATFPYVWLPAVHVFAAVILHALTLRKLRGAPS